MSDFVLGQRWVVDSEPELGLGVVVASEGRAVTVFFPLVDTERRYAADHAPLTRIALQVGDQAKDIEGNTYHVDAVIEDNGLLIYQASSATEDSRTLIETQLSPEIQLNQPLMRLTMGQVDRKRWFRFRRRLDAEMTRLWNSDLNGLLGVRASLVPHQLYVAATACKRDQVRVLLSDEVGLGKTVEAGMILNRLLKLDRIARALIVVPSALQVQWLVELVRRFGIQPVLFDEESHDFSFGQIHIVPHETLSRDASALLEAEFDLVILDEAHHLQIESDAFANLRSLSELCPHLVLMTATPEQLGLESHFARLQLLDPDKYTSLADFKREEEGFEALNKLIRDLPANRDTLIKDYGLDESDSDQVLIDQLLDYQGLGRVVFRNARRSVKGFPSRVGFEHVLESADWEQRYEWLAQCVRAHPDEKILVITHHRDHVAECEHYLWNTHGIDAAVFHEGLGLVERDRAAAYFADMENGAQVLLCSEMGSEGRNFQFSHILVCLDLPDHPDLLEQRIGRLDRIGQQFEVQVHALVHRDDDSAQRWQWYHDTLNCVEQQNPAAGAVHDELWPGSFGDIDTDLNERAKARSEALAQQIRSGRDALLELNSCRQPMAGELAEKIADFEQHSPKALIEEASDLLNFHFEDLGDGRYSLIPADNMLISALPSIPPEGVDLTFDRELANAREDLWFMTWDSLFIQGLWELLRHSEIGSAAVAILPTRQLPEAKCLLEACFTLVVQSEHRAACLPFFSALSLRVISSELAKKDLSQALPEEQLQNSLQKVDKKLARQIIASRKDLFPHWYAAAEEYASVKKETLVEEAVANAERHFDIEINRLTQLARKNPDLDLSELESIKARKIKLVAALRTNVVLQPAALRLVVTSTN
jgi:ATP-dependent helicase HepA